MPRRLDAELFRLCDQFELAKNEVVTLLSLTYGFGDPEALTADQRTELACEAEELAENWEKAENKDVPPTVRTRLQALLKIQREIGDRILTLEVERFRRTEI